jgi:hypothetical protein
VCSCLPRAPSRPLAAVTGIQQPPSLCRFASISCRICHKWLFVLGVGIAQSI